MASNVYYGTCITEADEQEKIVKINNAEVTTDNFTFETGDLLVVYFSDTNTAAAPSLVITNGDTEEEVSTSNDTGKFIKINSVEEIKDPEGIWDAGETVTFTYTKNVNSNDNVYYWELVDAARATIDISGVTKLYGTKSTNISEWLNSDFEDGDFDKALTPGILKKFFKSLKGEETEPEPTPTPTPTPSPSPSPTPTQQLIQLNWTPSIEDQDLVTLGKLSLTTKEGSGIDITFPLDNYITSKIGKTVSKTSDIGNDGPPASHPESSSIDGHFYITNVLPSDKSLYYSDSPNNYAFMIPNDNGNLTINSKGKVQLTGATGTSITNGLTVSGNSTLGNVTCGTINSGAINAGNNLIQTNGSIKAGGVIQEYNTNLNQRYSGRLMTRRLTKAVNIAKNSTTTHLTIGLGYNKWTPIGIVGCNFNYRGNNAGDAGWCHLWEWSITGNTLEFAIRNHANRTVYINAVFDVLYRFNV